MSFLDYIWGVNGLTWWCIYKCGLYGCFIHSYGLYLCRFVKLSVISFENFDIINLKKKKLEKTI